VRVLLEYVLLVEYDLPPPLLNSCTPSNSVFTAAFSAPYSIAYLVPTFCSFLGSYPSGYLSPAAFVTFLVGVYLVYPIRVEISAAAIVFFAVGMYLVYPPRVELLDPIGLLLLEDRDPILPEDPLLPEDPPP